MKKALLLFTEFSLIFMVGCQAVLAPTSQLATSTTRPVDATEINPVTIRIVVLPLIDTLPMFVAESENLYLKHGVKVEFVPVASAPERDQVLQAGQADVTVNEILSDMFMNKEKIQMEVVRYAHMASANFAHFYILASSQSGITTVIGLKGVEIGISKGTIIEYVTDRLLKKQGFTESEIKTISVPKMPERVSLLASGGLKAAVLPDPLAALSVQQGAKILLDDSGFPTYGASVISVTKSFIDAHPSTIKGFLAAIEEATLMVNSNPTKYSELLTEKQLVPAPLLGSYTIPVFPISGITSEAEWNDALVWAKQNGLITTDISYSESVNPNFLP